MKVVDPEILMGDVERRLGAPLEALAPLCARAARMADAGAVAAALKARLRAEAALVGAPLPPAPWRL